MQIAKLSFDCSEPIPPPTSVRGYIGWLVDDIALHNHLSKDAYIFGYPCVQYKKIADNYKIIGFNEGIDAVRAVELLLDRINYNVNGTSKTVEVKDKRLRIYEAPFGLREAIK